jgi:hypothetical protein
MDEDQLQAEIDKVESALNKTGKSKKHKTEDKKKRDIKRDSKEEKAVQRTHIPMGGTGLPSQ